MPPSQTKEIKAIVEDPKSPISSVSEAKRVQERVAIGAKVVYEAIRLEGEEELERPAVALAWSALAAGLSMGFSLVAEAALTSFLPEAPWRPLIARAGYSRGLLARIPDRHPRSPATLHRKHPDPNSPSFASQGFPNSR